MNSLRICSRCFTAEIKEILLSRSFDGYFSFADDFGGMNMDDLQEYMAAFKTLLKQM